MLKITHIKRSGLHGDHWTNPKTGRVTFRCFFYFNQVNRINFVRDGLHYSIQLGDNEGFDDESAVELRCKEDISFYRILGYGTSDFMNLLFGWKWNTIGNTYQTFPTDKLEEFIFGGEQTC